MSGMLFCMYTFFLFIFQPSLSQALLAWPLFWLVVISSSPKYSQNHLVYLQGSVSPHMSTSYVTNTKPSQRQLLFPFEYSLLLCAIPMITLIIIKKKEINKRLVNNRVRQSRCSRRPCPIRIVCLILTKLRYHLLSDQRICSA